MFKIIKTRLLSSYYYDIINVDTHEYLYLPKGPCKTLRDFIISFIELHNNYKMRPIKKDYIKYETIETLESLDLDYIKNKYIHYLI